MASHPLAHFHTFHYLGHTPRRQEHLASLNLPVAGRTVIELRAGIGDHTTFFLDRGRRVISIEALKGNVDIFGNRFDSYRAYELRKNLKIVQADNDDIDKISFDAAEIIYCFGLFYHLNDPEKAIHWMAANCKSLCLIETCVSFGDHEAKILSSEDVINPTQAFAGIGCRPKRLWIFNCLRKSFEYVYLPKTQPWHEEFPTDWTDKPAPGMLTWAIFIASREALKNPVLETEILAKRARL